MGKLLKKSKEYSKWLNKYNLPQNSENYEQFKFDFATQLIFLGFRDYLASRKLLLEDNGDYHLVGLVIASSAVEKYLKAYLCSADYYVGNIHLNKLKQFRDGLNNVGGKGIELLNKLDDKFLKLLSDTYKFRYFSETRNADGVYINQVLAELDFTVDLIESKIKISKTGGLINYQKASKDKNHPIHTRNYVLNGKDKSKFMEQDSKVYGVKALGKGMILEIQSKNPKKVNKYDGAITTLKIN